MSNLVSYREKVNRINIVRKLKKEQEKIDELYAQEGATDRVIEMQAELNSRRHEFDIPDESKKVWKNFVQ
ncbi:MAG: hypothetical protein E7Z77_02510 [Methanobrevibacter sp.]|uniref:hypothetical protein n=1 Tax=Methanobrevibacter sp. TaxID=66852 RepID=UPI0025D1ECD7|nr:hypothetical protein [Methanobrevibacter sp.]MBE6508267.1 hypothetical protein [Methanobrevibacter sp.]